MFWFPCCQSRVQYHSKQNIEGSILRKPRLARLFHFNQMLQHMTSMSVRNKLDCSPTHLRRTRESNPHRISAEQLSRLPQQTNIWLPSMRIVIILIRNHAYRICGGWGIRTPGALTPNGFQDRHHKPLGQSSSFAISKSTHWNQDSEGLPCCLGENRTHDFHVISVMLYPWTTRQYLVVLSGFEPPTPKLSV